MLKQRILTAAILIALVLITIFILPPLAFIVVTTVVFLYATWEYTQLIDLKTRNERLTYLGIMMVSLVVCLWIPVTILLAISFAGWLWVIYELIAYGHTQKKLSIQYRSVAGIFIIVPCWV